MGNCTAEHELEQMPVYPQEGYIQQIDGVVVVKFQMITKLIKSLRH